MQCDWEVERAVFNLVITYTSAGAIKATHITAELSAQALSVGRLSTSTKYILLCACCRDTKAIFKLAS
jgi:hypothetical protein